MKLIPQHIDELIVRWLDKKTTADENLQLENWKKLSAENQKYFNDMTFIFENSTKKENPIHVNTTQAWNAILPQLHKNDAHVVDIKTKPSFSFLSIAASVAFLCLIATVIWFVAKRNGGHEQLTAIVTHDASEQHQLPDGSIITMQPKSKLTPLYANKREYNLTGTANFNVKHNAKNPFIIHHENVLIEDIGTTFNVTALPDANTVKVVVTEGTVHLYTPNNQGIVLNAGETGVYYKDQKIFAKTIKQDQVESITSSLVFENEKLKNVVEQLNNVYQSKIVLNNLSIGDCRITVRFNNDDLHDVLDIVTETLDLWVSTKGDTIVLGGKSCLEK